MLAGDTLRSAADLGLSMVGVTLVHRRGYFFQRLDARGRQTEEAVSWSPDDWLEAADARADVEVEGRRVLIRAWIYRIEGVLGGAVPVVLLDTNLPENDPYDRRLTDSLYGGDARYRLCQETVLGIGGVRMLRALGYKEVAAYHLNEGHSALLVLERLREELAADPDLERAIERVAERCVFTTHTPVPAGHDQFVLDLAQRVLGAARLEQLRQADAVNSSLNLTLVALRFSHYVNGVTRRHAEVSRSLFPGYPIASITNGVHSVTWTTTAFRDLYDRQIPEWRRNPYSLRYVSRIPLDEIRHAHEQAKWILVQEVNERTNAGFDKDVLTIGFARRATAYKRPALILHDLARLRATSRACGGLQLVFAGKAHPDDREGKAAIEAIVTADQALTGVHGTDAEDAAELYRILDEEVAPAFANPQRWATLMRSTIAVNAHFFNSHRMLQEYLAMAYRPASMEHGYTGGLGLSLASSSK